jgi:hypothetical protein
MHLRCYTPRWTRYIGIGYERDPGMPPDEMPWEGDAGSPRSVAFTLCLFFINLELRLVGKIPTAPKS